MRHDGRKAAELRELDILTDYLEQPHGSVLYAQGKSVCDWRGWCESDCAPMCTGSMVLIMMSSRLVANAS